MAYASGVGFARQLGVVLLLIASFAAPVMTCATAEAQKTAEERACCRMMKGDCGQMEMPASHGCCKKTAGTVHDDALKADAVSLQPLVVAVVSGPVLDLLPPQDVSPGWLQRPEHSPPKSPPLILSTFRV